MNIKKTFISLMMILSLTNIIANAQEAVGTCSYNKSHALEALLKNQKLSHEKALIGDTIHISNYTIYIDTTRFSDSTIWGHTNMEVVSKMNNVNNITLNLLNMTIDSISSNNIPITNYTYNSPNLYITTPSTMNINDSIPLKIYYHGHPKEDLSGWGGFYWVGGYAFSVGVAFTAIPHNFGRCWYPCIDEFTDKSFYEFYVACDTPNNAVCNGLLLNTINNLNGTNTYHWKLNEAIPSYLSCMAVGPFYTLQRTADGIPVKWFLPAADTNSTLATFINLNAVLANDTSHWGPYRWEKIGYVETPINIGGMEHATAINIGSAFMNGTLTYEYLYAHELSHHWFGDLITCKTAADMWLNEGWACYNESFFYQAIYGETTYRNWHRTNHRKVLQFAHIVDSAYLTLNNIPIWDTYDDLNVYQKGADMVRNIRNYMGDSLFFPSVRGYLNDFAWGNPSSYDLMNKLTQYSGIDMTRFFNDWIFQPGFPHYSIDSVTSVPNGNNFDVTVYTRQRHKGTTHNTIMPVDITFADGVDSVTNSVVIDTNLNSFNFTLPFNPTWTAIDRNEKVAHAVSCYERYIDTTGSFSFPETNATLISLNAGTGNNFVRIEHNWVAPDGFKRTNPGIRLSDYHYYKVDGIFSPGFVAKSIILYNGKNDLTSGYIDNTLITGTEDSLVLLYRANTADDWHLVSDYTKNMGNVLDKAGSFSLDTLLKGEYVFGYYDYTVTGINEIKPNSASTLQVYPNPNEGIVNITLNLNKGEQGLVKITDVKGAIVYSDTIKFPNDKLVYDASKLSAGAYLVSLEIKGKNIASTKFILNHTK
jgi:hypothetical protein